MTSVTVREVQHNLAAILRRVEAGEEIEICRRRRRIARLVPAVSTAVGKVDWSDLTAWRRKTWGGKPTPGTPVELLVAETRGDR